MSVLLIAALLLGCPGGGGETPATTPSEGGGAAPAGGGAAPDTGGAAAGPAAGGAVSDGGGGAAADGGQAAGTDASSEFESMFANVASLEYKVDYETTITSGGETLTSASTMVLKGQKMRTDTQFEYQGETSRTSTYFIEDGIYVCTFDPQATCMKLGSAEEYEEDETSAMAEEVESNPEDYSIYSRPSRTIAGINAMCFGFTGADIEGDLEVCYAPQGVMLYMHYAYGSDEYTMIATSAQIGSVSDSEFVLPAEPIDLGDIYGQYGIDTSAYT